MQIFSINKNNFMKKQKLYHAMNFHLGFLQKSKNVFTFPQGFCNFISPINPAIHLHGNNTTLL